MAEREPSSENLVPQKSVSPITQKDRFLAQVREWDMIRAMGGYEFYKLLF